MATFQQLAQSKQLKFRTKIAQYGVTVVRTRESGPSGGQSIVSMKMLLDVSNPQVPTESRDQSGFNQYASDNRVKYYFADNSDILEGDIITRDSLDYTVSLAETFSLSDVKIYKDVRMLRRKVVTD